MKLVTKDLICSSKYIYLLQKGFVKFEHIVNPVCLLMQKLNFIIEICFNIWEQQTGCFASLLDHNLYLIQEFVNVFWRFHIYSVSLAIFLNLTITNWELL